MVRTRYIFGVDLGRVKDYTAIVGVRMDWGLIGKRPSYSVGFIQRFNETSGAHILAPYAHPGWDFYTQVHAHLCSLFEENTLPDGRVNRRYANSDVVVDGTGSGYHVAHQFGTGKLARIAGLKVLMIRAGDTKVRQRESGRIVVGRSELVDTVALVAPRMAWVPNADATEQQIEMVKDEMKAVRRKEPRGDVQTDMRTRGSDHDDTVLALAMALWVGERTWESGAGGLVNVRWA